MEAVEEPPLLNPSTDGVKATVMIEESSENSVVSVQADVCHKSNGVAESAESGDSVAVEPDSVPLHDNKTVSDTTSTKTVTMTSASEAVSEEPAASSTSMTDDTEPIATDCTEPKPSEDIIGEPTANKTEVIEEVVQELDKSELAPKVEIEESTATENIVEPVNDRVFQTEIVIETNDTDTSENVVEETTVQAQNAAHLLSGLVQNIELTEALRSSDVTENVDNNNCTVRQEVFNKEELLDILEGNDEEMPNVVTASLQNLHSDKMLEAKKALQQLSRLKGRSKRNRSDRQSKGKKPEKKIVKQETTVNSLPAINNASPPKKEENLINVIVNDWEDDDPTEAVESTKLMEDSEKLLKSSNEIVEAQETVTKKEEASERTSVDSGPADETPNLNKSGDESQPQRRLGRLIKKKVIFDPDNPDTFTKSKVTVKSKETVQEKDQLPIKKIKSEQIIHRSKSKSPLSKLQWKKPTPKSCKQNKRLSEVDRLLMDEGAVNMIYQLTPEAPKGKKNMRTKAEFIKKIQSSTPDSKEMKFRERKKESKYEEGGEAKKILGSKQRPSLSSSVKSPSVCEDFEAHSADDSIIYRRHSSSSYSSSCMSPRRLSDFEGSAPPVARNSQVSDVQTQASNEEGSERPTVDVFMSDNIEPIRTDMINKDDCLSIKEKLNSKLNLALNKRKRENSKVDKPSKIKKITKTIQVGDKMEGEDFKHLSIIFDDKLAEICIRKSGSKTNVELIKELERALTAIDSRKDISVTLLTSECGTLCSDLDLRPLLESDMEKKTNSAYDIAESVRRLLEAMQHHSKLVCSGVNGRCSGVGLAMIGLSDVAMASDRASFSFAQKSHAGSAPVMPGVAVFSAYRLLPQPLLNDLVLFGRRLSASEAVQGGLVSRTLWPERFYEQVRSIAKDITVQSTQNIILKKQLLNLKNSGSEQTFLTSLEKERDLLVEYWTSVEGQDILRVLFNTS